MCRPALLFVLAACGMAPQILPAQSRPAPATRYHYGDNPAWANPVFDDSNWTPAPDGAWPFPPLHSDGFVWVRFRLPAPATPEGGLALQIDRFGSPAASEQVFVDGVLIGHAGKLPPAPQPVILQSSVFPVPVAIPAHQAFATAALRLWYPPLLRYEGGEDWVRAQLGSAALLAQRQRADRLALILSWLPFLSLNALLALVGVGLLALWHWSRRRELFWFSLLLVFYPFSALFSALTAVAPHPIASGLSSRLAVLGDTLTMFVTVEFLWVIFNLRNRWLRILLHAAWVVFNAVGLVASFITSGYSHFAWMTVTVIVAVSAFNLGTLLVDLRFLATGPNRTIAAGMAVIPVASSLLFWLHLNPTNLFGIPHLELFNTGFLLAGGFLSVMLVRRALAEWQQTSRLRVEFSAAREVQQRLVPATLPAIGCFRIQAEYLPAQEVGGDFYQVLPQPGASALIVVGDVSGKGLKAAMTGTLALGALRTLAQQSLSPAQILFRLNAQLAAAPDGGFITCLCARISPDGALTLANAGHLPPYRNGEEVPVESSLPLGIAPDATYTETTFQLAPNDRLTFLSDGVVEAQSPTGELFGFDRTRQISAQSAEAIAHAAQAHGQEDDITVLTLTFAPAQVLHA